MEAEAQKQILNIFFYGIGGALLILWFLSVLANERERKDLKKKLDQTEQEDNTG